MKEIFKTYKAKIFILTPTHIGCGDEYSPQDFYVIKQFSDKEKKYFELGVHFKAQSMITNEQFKGDIKERFKNIAMENDIETVRDLLKFHATYKWKGRKILLSSSFIEHYNQVMGLTNAEFHKEMQSFQIQRTSYNQHSGEPYIPGSSLKGALRTAIIAKCLQTSTQWEGNPKKYTFKENKDLEAVALGIQDDKQLIQEDPLFNLSVSDFQLFESKSNKQLPTMIMHVMRIKKNPPSEVFLPLINEMIQPFQYFEGTISFRKMRKSEINITEDLLIDSCSSYYEKIMEEESNVLGKLNIDPKARTRFYNYKKEVRGDKDPKLGRYFLIRLGRYKGAESQTLPGYRDIKIRTKEGTKYGDSATTFSLAEEKDKTDSKNGVPPGWAVVELASY